MQKYLQEELGRGNIRLSIRFLRILTAHEFDMGNSEYNRFLSHKIDLGWTFSYVNKVNPDDNSYLTNCCETSVRVLNLPVYSIIRLSAIVR